MIGKVVALLQSSIWNLRAEIIWGEDVDDPRRILRVLVVWPSAMANIASEKNGSSSSVEPE
jgi:hypothetical protein